MKVTFELLRACSRARRASSCVDGGVLLFKGMAGYGLLSFFSFSFSFSFFVFFFFSPFPEDSC